MTLQLPQGKGDVEIALALADVPVEALAPHVPELLTWLQDINWPVAHPVVDVLARCGLVLVEPIRSVLGTDDDVWKFWVVSALLRHVEPSVRVALRADLIRLATQPTAGERAEEADEAAREVLLLDSA